MKVTDEQILTAMLERATISGAAEALGVARNSLSERLRREPLKSRWAELRGQMLADTAAALQTASVGAVQAARDVLNDSAVSPQIRLNAAALVLSNALRFTEQTDVLKRLEALEEAQREDEKE